MPGGAKKQYDAGKQGNYRPRAKNSHHDRDREQRSATMSSDIQHSTSNIQHLPIPRLMIAAPASGAGKTTVAVALMRLLAARGLRVAPFKVGPDYIDPTHHQAAAERTSRNLDGWLLPTNVVRALFQRATTGDNEADVAILEGVMGLFDGRSARAESGSTAQIAKLLRTPVVLVLDASAMARTAAAIVYGLDHFDPDLRLDGVVLNRIAGPAHYELCREAILESTDVPVLGWLSDNTEFAIPERHLGLALAGEYALDLNELAGWAADTLDVDALLAIARSAPPLSPTPDPLPIPVRHRRAVIAVARDRAFHFYYPDNLDLLRDLGAELRFFSPMEDAEIPPDAGALYLGGGYPELHGAALSTNSAMRLAVRTFAASGRPVYAECGGLMYLSEALVDGSGVHFPMVGLIPGTSVMQPDVAIGYREAEALKNSPIARVGWTVRGHEFHYSTLTPEPPDPAYRRPGGTETEGTVVGPAENVLASYIHIHFAADPRLAERFVQQAELWSTPHR